MRNAVFFGWRSLDNAATRSRGPTSAPWSMSNCLAAGCVRSRA